MAVINVNLHQPSSNAIQSTKTPYQQVFSKPVQQEWKVGDKPTNYGQALATINELYKTDPTKAQEKLTLLNQYRTQPGNMWYDPFSVATNNVVGELKSYGIDPAELTDDWFKANTSWQGYLSYNGTTTTPSKPGKKASAQEKAAYALYQFQNSMGTTSAAKNEWAAAQDEIAYWANRKDLNLSDDDIIQKVLGSNKYSTLKKMDDSRTTGKPLELNEAIDYNPDSVRGVLWAARNGGGTGNSRQDIANYYSKVGNGWIANEDISAKLNKANLATYSPHEIGMTGKDMDEVGAYFGVGSFAPGEIEAMRSKIDWEDATSVKMWQKGYDSEQTTLKAEEELAEFNKQFERRLNRGFKDQNAADKWIEDQLNSGDFNTLAKMDSGIQKGEPINMTRAVPYRKQMYQNLAAEAIANPKKSGSEIMESYGIPVSEADKATTKVENENFGSALDAMGSFLSKGEKDYFDAVPGVDYARLTAGYNGIAEGMKSGMINVTNHATQYAEEANGKYNKTWLGSLASRNQYERYQATADRLAAEVDDFEKNNGIQILASESIESEPIFSLDDGTQVQLIYDDETGEYEVGNVWNDMWRFGQTSPEQLAAANEKAEQLRIEQNNRASGIRTAQTEAGELDADTVKGVEEYNKKKEQLAALNDYLEANKAGYEQSIRDAETAKANRDALGEIAAKALGVAYDPSTADSIMQYAGGWYDYESPPADGFTLIEETSGKSNDDIKAEIEANNANVQDLQFVLSMLGDNAPEDLKQKINQAISDAEKQNRVYGDYMVTKDPRFAYLAKKGREELYDEYMGGVVQGNTKQWFGMMSPEEMDIYFALAERDGIEAADQFYSDISDELPARANKNIDKYTEQISKSGWLGRFASEVGSILLAPANSLMGGLYSLGIAMGKDPTEMSAFKLTSHVSQSMHNANVTEIKNIYGEDTTLGQALSGLYEIMYNRGNSLMNALTWGKLMPHLAAEGKVADFINSVISATPIALSAASDALESAIDRGADPTQQAIIFASTLIAESWTEGIEFGHIEEAGKLLLTKKDITKFLKDYIPKALSEVVGESANDLIENAADYWVKYINNPDYKTQHDEAVKKALAEDDTLTPEQAEALVHQAEVDGVLHTAIISFFSPGADVVSMAGNTLTTYYEYAKEARAYNNGLQPQVRLNNSKSIRDIRLEHEAAEEAKNNPQPVATETVSETTSPATQPEAEAPVDEYEAHAAQMDTYDANIILLEEASNANATAQAAAIASVINTGNTYAAQAAAAKLDLFTTQGVMIAGRSLGIDPQIISTGLQLGALSNGACAELLNNGIENGLGTFGIAEGLVSAVNADMQNETVAQGVAAGIHDARVDEEMKRLMAGLKTTSESTPTNAGEAMERLSAKTAVDAMEAVDNARNETKTAEAVLEIKQNELAVAQQGVSDAAAAVANDPVNDGNQMTAALSKMIAASAVVQEYTQKLEKARENQRAVEDKNMKLIEETTAGLRQEAENTVTQQEAVEAEQARVAAEQAQAEAQARAEAERAEQMARNITTLQTEDFVEKYYPNATEEQKKNIADRIDYMKQQTSAEAILDRAQFVKSLSNKFGTKIRVADTTEGGTKARSNAYVDVNTGEIVVDRNSTMSDIIYAVLPHELMHLAEKSGNYKALADTLLQIKYGKGVTYDSVLQAANGGDRSGAMATAVADLLARKTLYDERLGSTHTNEYALQETVADLMGGLFRSGENGGVNADLVNRLVAEEPNVAKRIMNAIKNFIRKMAGFNDPALTQAQMAVDMLNEALKNRKANGNGVKNSLDTTVIATDNNGEPLASELTGGTVTKDSLSSWTPEEITKVKKNLKKNGFTDDQIQKWVDDVNSVAAVIAADHDRLDFIPDLDQQFKKPNGDVYKWTLDASTLCAKRLLYQGTFNAIQKALPNVPLRPGDLIELANMMHEMGYQTPCGICYVESRRRHLGNFTEEFLADYNGEYKPTYAELTSTDGLAKLKKEHRQAYDDYIAAMNGKGVASPKVVQLRTNYRGDVRNLRADSIKYLKDIGGLRIQSFSDFETPHLMDMMQAVLDMAAVKLTSQAYTKVPNFAWVFGDTGIKINLSLMGEGTGVDENGNLIFSNTEGMDFDEAMRLRDRYSKNVGTILVGMNDAHIIAAMGDNRIDYIIPFHKSGWSEEELSKMKALENYTDYQNTQNELWITGQKEDGSYITASIDKKTGNLDPYGENGYWEYEKTGRENAEKYLRLCAEQKRLPKFSQFLVDNGDGSFSLPQGDDVRSTNIREGYWKTLIDFKMYDNDGVGAPQEEVKPNINMPEAYRVLNEYEAPEGGNNALPVADPVVEEYVKWFKKEHPEIGETEDIRHSLSDIEIDMDEVEKAVADHIASMSTDELLDYLGLNLPKSWRSEEQVQEFKQEVKSRKQLNAEYDTAINNGDIAKAGELADEAAKKAGYTLKGIHRTNGRFTVFDKSKQTGERGKTLGNAFYISSPAGSEYDSDSYGKNRMEVYVKTGKMFNLHDGLSKQKAEKVYDKYFAPFVQQDYDDIHKKHVIGQLQKGYKVMDYIDEAAEKNGTTTDEIFKWLGYNSIKDGPQYAIFDPSQIKSADPVTYDDEGNAIPLGKRFKKANDDIRYSLPADAPYLAAVERGEMDEAAAYVRQKAAESGAFTNERGRPIKLYHGTKNGFGFTVFDTSRAGWGLGAIWTTSNPSVARGYSDFGYDRSASSKFIPDDGTDETIIRNAKNVLNSDVERLSEEKENEIRQKELEKYRALAEMENAAMGESQDYSPPSEIDYDFWNVVQAFNNILGEDEFLFNDDLSYREAYRSSYSTQHDIIGMNLVDARDRIREYFNNNDSEMERLKNDGSGYYNLLFRGFDHGDGIIDLEYSYKPLLRSNDNFIYTATDQVVSREDLERVIEQEERRGSYTLYGFPGDNPLEIDAEKAFWTGIKAPIIGEGYYSTDSIVKWAKENGYTSVIIRNVMDPGVVNAYGDDYVFFNADQLKSADAVTYDDNGNVIPLSERFNDQNEDIRYSLPSNEVLDQQIRHYLTAPLEGENPSATIPSEGNAQRQFGSQTAQRSDELDASVRQFLKDNSGYIPDTNEAQINRAIQWIRSNKNSNESDGLAESIQKIAMEDFDYRSADGQARMIATMGLAVAKNDAIAQAALADAYNRQGTDLGRALQARKLFRLMTPAGRVETLRKMLQNTQDELAAKGRKIDLKFSDWMYMAASAANNEGDFRKVQKRAAEELAAQIPANWKDKARAFRMLAMLGNPRTHVRNVIGNALFIPAVSIKNKLGAVAELGLEKGERTKTLRVAVDKSIRDFAKQDAIAMKDELTGDSRWNEGNAVRREVKPFKGFMQKLVDANGNALEFEDWFFLKGHYTRALGGWMQANGYTAEQMRNNPALLEKGRAYAVQEAQKATYRDANKLAQTLNKVSREGGVAGFLVDAVLPFKKTPANILRRGIEYSPVGVLKTLTADSVHLKQYLDAKNKKLSVMPDKAISPNQFIDHLCAGLTGSAIMAVGALLASMGIASAGMDDDDDKFDELRGGQEYSFKVNLFGQDVTYTMDWAAPMSMPFFVGAAIFDQLNGERGDFNIENLINDLGAMAEPVFNLSMLDGVNTLFQTSQYDDTNTITQIGGKIASNYVTSYIPSLLGATARTIDPVRRKSFVKAGEGGGLMGTFRYAIEQTQNKIPGLSQQNIAYRNAWGEADESSTIEKIFENFLSPGYISPVKEDPVLDELERLYNSTEVDDSTRSSLIPKLPNKSVSGTALEAEQYDAVTIQRGQTAKNLLTELMNTDYFKSAADQDRAKMVSDVWTFATQTANNAAVGRKLDGWVLNTQTNPVQGIINRSKKTVADETKDGWKAEAVQAVQMGDFDALDVCIERLGELGVKKSSVKTAVGNAFKEDYIKAYQRDDYATMYDIEGTLEDTGLFTYADFEKWLDDMNKAIIEDEEI